jgi:hypothetical protein
MLKEIVPGLPVDVVINTNVMRSSIIQDIREDRLVLLQIFPPLDRRFLHKLILVTYVKEDSDRMRYGFLADVVELREGYVINGRGFPAIIMRRLTGVEKCDLRSHQRIKPKRRIEVMLDNEGLEVVDISRGGVHFIRKAGKRSSVSVGDIICLTMNVGIESLQRDARIVRQWHTKGSDGPEHVAVSFLDELPASIIEDLTCKRSSYEDVILPHIRKNLGSWGSVIA